MCKEVAEAFLYCVVLSLIGMLSIDVGLGLFIWAWVRDHKWAYNLNSDPIFRRVRTCYETGEEFDNDIWDEDYNEDGSFADDSKTARVLHTEDEYTRPPYCKHQHHNFILIKAVLDRITLPVEQVYLYLAVILVLASLVIYILPFTCRLKVTFRKLVQKLGWIYIGLGVTSLTCAICGIAGLIEIDTAYYDYEELARRKDMGGIMLMSCVNEEYYSIMTKLNLKAKRDSIYVCHDYWKKMGSNLCFVGSGILQFIIAGILTFQYRYLMENDIISDEERADILRGHYQETVIANNDVEDKKVQQEQLKEKKTGLPTMTAGTTTTPT